MWNHRSTSVFSDSERTRVVLARASSSADGPEGDVMFLPARGRSLQTASSGRSNQQRRISNAARPPPRNLLLTSQCFSINATCCYKVANLSPLLDGGSSVRRQVVRQKKAPSGDGSDQSGSRRPPQRLCLERKMSTGTREEEKRENHLRSPLLILQTPDNKSLRRHWD